MRDVMLLALIKIGPMAISMLCHLLLYLGMYIYSLTIYIMYKYKYASLEI